MGTFYTGFIAQRQLSANHHDCDTALCVRHFLSDLRLLLLKVV